MFQLVNIQNNATCERKRTDDAMSFLSMAA